MKLRTLARVAKQETATVEVFSGYDGQGLPSYAPGVDVTAWVRRMTAHIIGADGSEETTTLNVYVPGGSSVVPDREDRITYGGTTYIVRERDDRKRFDGDLDHALLRCREES